MRVLYNTCVADPFLLVARRMQQEYGYEPVYWIGYNYDNSETIVRQMFPDICYQPYHDAWRCIFPDNVRKRAAECYLDIDLLNKLSRYELQAIKMMDRLDYDTYSFNYMERERHYLNLLKSWMACLDIYKPDIVVSAVNPHRVYDYVLYLLCKEKNIPFMCFQYSMCRERIYSTDNFYTIGDAFEKDYKRYLTEGNLKKERLPVEVRLQYEKVLEDYENAKPSYMKTHDINNKKYTNIFFLAKLFLKKYKIFGKDGVFVKGVSVTMMKIRGFSLEYSKLSVLGIIRKDFARRAMSKAMHKYYNTLISDPVDNVKYILFPLHYQPEATTSPAGDMFVNQRLCIETLLKNTPDDYFIYVKEHPQQFMSHMLGQTSRIKEFYTDILASHRVKLMPLEMDSYSLMRNATAVATVTGTVGWEALMHRIPVILFGMIWYEKLSGVLRITDSSSASKIETFINSYKFDEQKVLAYLMAFADNSIVAYHYNGRKEKMNIDENTCVTNLTNEILHFVEKHK